MSARLVALVFSIIVAMVQGWPHLGLLGLALAGGRCRASFSKAMCCRPNWWASRSGLHPVWLIFALFAFGSLMGFSGMILAVPLAAAMGVVIRFAVRRYKQSALFSGIGLDAA